MVGLSDGHPRPAIPDYERPTLIANSHFRNPLFYLKNRSSRPYADGLSVKSGRFVISGRIRPATIFRPKTAHHGLETGGVPDLFNHSVVCMTTNAMSSPGRLFMRALNQQALNCRIGFFDQWKSRGNTLLMSAFESGDIASRRPVWPQSRSVRLRTFGFRFAC